MKRIIAHNLLSKGLDIEVYKILPQMLVVEPMAEYYSVNSNKDCKLHFPVSIDEKEIRKGHEYTHYKINGKLYDSVGTSKIDYWLKQRQENVQLALF